MWIITGRDGGFTGRKRPTRPCEPHRGKTTFLVPVVNTRRTGKLPSRVLGDSPRSLVYLKDQWEVSSRPFHFRTLRTNSLLEGGHGSPTGGWETTSS